MGTIGLPLQYFAGGWAVCASENKPRPRAALKPAVRRKLEGSLQVHYHGAARLPNIHSLAIRLSAGKAVVPVRLCLAKKRRGYLRPPPASWNDKSQLLRVGGWALFALLVTFIIFIGFTGRVNEQQESCAAVDVALWID